MPINQDQRNTFLVEWSRVLRCENEPHIIAAELIKRHKNYQSACYLIFGLSVHEHQEYVVAAADHLKEAIAGFPEGSEVEAEWLRQFVQYYISEVKPYPENG